MYNSGSLGTGEIDLLVGVVIGMNLGGRNVIETMQNHTRKNLAV